jgi:hypothetical protein
MRASAARATARNRFYKLWALPVRAKYTPISVAVIFSAVANTNLNPLKRNRNWRDISKLTTGQRLLRKSTACSSFNCYL